MNVPTSPSDRPSWLQRNWKWVVPIGCLVPVSICDGFVVLILTIVMTAIKSSDPYQDRLDSALADDRVATAIGEPISDGMWINGSIEVDGSTGSANLAIPLSGPKGSATLHVVAEKEAGN